MSKKQKNIIASGARKTAVARATIKAGTGVVTVNNEHVDHIEPRMARLKIQTPLLIAPDAVKKIDISVSVNGGGVNARAEAVAQAIAKALVESDEKLEKSFLDYDRRLLVADVRKREERKPNCRGRARAKRQKSYR